jgi:hypothetical protein
MAPKKKTPKKSAKKKTPRKKKKSPFQPGKNNP